MTNSLEDLSPEKLAAMSHAELCELLEHMAAVIKQQQTTINQLQCVLDEIVG